MESITQTRYWVWIREQTESFVSYILPFGQNRLCFQWYNILLLYLHYEEKNASSTPHGFKNHFRLNWPKVMWYSCSEAFLSKSHVIFLLRSFPFQKSCDILAQKLSFPKVMRYSCSEAFLYLWEFFILRIWLIIFIWDPCGSHMSLLPWLLSSLSLIISLSPTFYFCFALLRFALNI